MRLAITKQDIELGHLADSATCPIALSMNRRLGHGFTARVNMEFLTVMDASGLPIWRTDLSEAGRVFVFRYDKGKAVSPTSLMVHCPTKLLRDGPGGSMRHDK